MTVNFVIDWEAHVQRFLLRRGPVKRERCIVISLSVCLSVSISLEPLDRLSRKCADHLR